MKVFKKICNVFGILLAWLLSIVLVVMLMVTPVTCSALDLLNPDTVTTVVTEVLDRMMTQDTASDYRIDRLTETTVSFMVLVTGSSAWVTWVPNWVIQP